eukprot:1216585-Rhodomonas_salina.1
MCDAHVVLAKSSTDIAYAACKVRYQLSIVSSELSDSTLWYHHSLAQYRVALHASSYRVALYASSVQRAQQLRTIRELSTAIRTHATPRNQTKENAFHGSTDLLEAAVVEAPYGPTLLGTTTANALP